MTCHIGPRELRRNITFLTNEIEPKLFVSCFENTDIKTEDIISSDSRRNRCKKFVESMIKAGQSAIDKFIKDLKRQDMTFVLDVLCRKENENQGVTTEGNVNISTCLKHQYIHTVYSFTDKIKNVHIYGNTKSIFLI